MNVKSIKIKNHDERKTIMRIKTKTMYVKGFFNGIINMSLL